MQTVPVPAAAQDFGDTIRTSLTGAFAMFFSSIPRILAFLVILLVGWFVASLIAKGVAAILRAVQFNDLAQRAGLAGFVEKMGVKTDSTGVLASVSKWFIRLIALVVAFDALGLPAVSQVLEQFLLWIPNLIVAIVVLVVAGLAAGALSKLVRGATAEAGFSNPDLLATIAKVAVLSFGVIVAVNQIGIATALINTLLIGVVGALALASGLAFGLGGQQKAAEWLNRAAEAGSEAAPKAAQAARAAKQQSDRPSPSGREWDVGITPSPMRADDSPGDR